MKTFKFLSLILMIFSLTGNVSTQTKKRRTSKKTKTKITRIPAATSDKPTTDAVKILAEGADSKIETPFIFVARSNETYARLQNLVDNLPRASEIDFGKSAIVAAFAGAKNTGGFSVSIKNSTGKIYIDTTSPPKGAMVAQLITAPFNVALVPLEENDALNLEVPAVWKNAAQIYKITAGAFDSYGGFVGKSKKFDVEGTIGLLSFGDYATLVFNLAGKGAEKWRKIKEKASGLMKDGKIDLARLDAGNFAENPNPPLKVSGTIANEKLSLEFELLPSRIADGFQARGKIEVVKVK